MESPEGDCEPLSRRLPRESICCPSLQPAPHARAVVAIGVAERALKISFLTGHHAVANYKGEGHERPDQPKAVEGNGETDEPEKHAEVDGIAREAVGSALDDGSGRHVGGHVRAGLGDGGDRPGDERQREDEHNPADPARGQRGWQERQGHGPLQGESGEHRERPRDRRPNDDIGGVCAITHG